MGGSDGGDLAGLLEQRRANGVLAWLLAAVVALVVAERTVAGDLLAAAVAATVLFLALVPPVAHRDPVVMLPWEVFALAALPILGRITATFWLTSEIAAHLSVAALALVVAVELNAFTTVRMPPWFAVLFVVIATMAVAGVVTVTGWLADLWLGTAFVLDPALTETEIHGEVMGDLVAATGAGALAGVVFEWYFRRKVGGERRRPGAVVE